MVSPQTPKNIVSLPPFNEQVLNSNGKMSRPWSIWFRDMFKRTSDKTGNAIDNNYEEISSTAEQVAQNVLDISANVLAISNNAVAISNNTGSIGKNALAISQNAEAIAINLQNILNLEYRSFGESRPDAYKTSGVAYAVGDPVVYPDTDPQSYYLCDATISDPAGVFDPLLWVKKSIADNLATETFLNLGYVKAAHGSFKGRSTNGPVTPIHSYNIESIDRTAIGVYEIAIEQATFYGVNILDSTDPLFSFTIEPSIDADAFHVSYERTDTDIFVISVFELVISPGGRIEYVPYDPDGTNDEIFIALFSDVGDGHLPPP